MYYWRITWHLNDEGCVGTGFGREYSYKWVKIDSPQHKGATHHSVPYQGKFWIMKVIGVQDMSVLILEVIQ